MRSLQVLVFNILAPFLLLLINNTKLPAQTITTEEWKNLTTSGQLPPQIKVQHSNNNLDLVRYNGKYFLAFRTAPTHFASTKTVLYVVSSADLENWSYETEIKLGFDLREPRFAVYHDTLHLIFFRGGKRTFRFEPQEILMCSKSDNDKWSVPGSVHLDGYVPWRIRERNDTLYLSAYYGKNLYNKHHQSDLRLFASVDAHHWVPISEKTQIDAFTAEEGEFIFDSAGNLYATVRLEGTGAFICSADKSSIYQWNKMRTKTKYDSALLFEHKNSIYLISRRNLDGDIDKLKKRTDEKKRRVRNLIRYSITRKVTSLFKLDKTNLTLSLLATFPSTGDNAYPAIAKGENGAFILMNYSSKINGRKKNWLNGQLGKTYIYWTRLSIQP